ncbi:MAG: AAA domain-containing protein [Cyanothece sp. SIO2G6]|nr:AAA domain-containing protein [Cyanothece sp. SIO2G6]
MKFRVFLEQYDGDHWEGRVLLVPAIATTAPTQDQVLSNLAHQLQVFLRDEDLDYVLSHYRFESNQTLMALDLDVVSANSPGSDPILLSLDVVVTRRTVRRGTRSILTVPHIPNFSLSFNRADKLEQAARDALLKQLKNFSVRDIDALDRSATTALAVVEVDGPPTPFETPKANVTSHPPRQTVLDQCGINLSQQAAANQVGHFDGRDAVLEQAIALLAQSGPSSMVLVGPSGVGKTALVEEIARRIQAQQVPQPLQQRSIWFVTANNLIAGQKYTGEWQGQVQNLIQVASKGRQILLMGNPNGILDAGRWSESDNNMGRFLRPYMESGAITVICECSSEEYDVAEKLEPSFVRAMQRIDLLEPTVVETTTIIQQATQHLMAEQPVQFGPTVVETAINLTQRFLPYQAFPGKAVNLLATMMRDRLTQAESTTTSLNLSSQDLLVYFAKMTGLPLALLSDAEKLDVEAVRQYFGDRLLGQPDAVAAVTDLITIIKAGLNDPHKPLGSFFFVGPTGVGKTELAKLLAAYLFGNSDRLLRFDMSEYASGDALARLIGTAWQPKSGGELTRRVREQPFSIILLDELEKANPVIFDALLGVLGEGRLTNAAGQTTDFRNTIIIMTSNLGASQSQSPTLGFATDSSDDDGDRTIHYIAEAERFFRPEFFNRIDHVVVFQSLSFEAMGRITRRELDKLLEREGIQKRDLLVEIDDAVIGQLLAQGFHPRYGARPLKREIEKTVIVPLASLLIRQEPNANHILRFQVRSGKVHLALIPIATPAEPAAEPAPTVKQAKAIASLLTQLADLQEVLLEIETSPMFESLRSTMNRLLTQSYAPHFWDEPTTARQTLSRIYHLDRVINRWGSLLERSDRLIVKGEAMQRSSPPASALMKLEADTDQLEADISYWQLECAGLSSGYQHDRVLLSFVAIGPDSQPWLEQLVQVYTTWAERKGYECERLIPRGDRRAWGLYINGSNVFTILQGEAGLHKLSQSGGQSGNQSGGDRQKFLVRLRLIAVPETISASDNRPDDLHFLMMTASTTDTADADILVRVYSQGRRASIRDPRTGVKVGNVRSVLEQGDLDVFLLAALQQENVE